jgi:hypothetical protein
VRFNHPNLGTIIAPERSSIPLKSKKTAEGEEDATVQIDGTGAEILIGRRGDLSTVTAEKT